MRRLTFKNLGGNKTPNIARSKIVNFPCKNLKNIKNMEKSAKKAIISKVEVLMKLNLEINGIQIWNFNPNFSIFRNFRHKKALKCRKFIKNLNQIRF